jgi:diacylglycerol kinase (ATP)
MPFAWIISDHWGVFLLLILPLVFMMSMELMNTAIESIVDYVSHDQILPIFKRIKDCASASVMVMALFGAIVWIWGIGRFVTL